MDVDDEVNIVEGKKKKKKKRSRKSKAKVEEA